MGAPSDFIFGLAANDKYVFIAYKGGANTYSIKQFDLSTNVFSANEFSKDCTSYAQCNLPIYTPIL
jgi:hypothetical protein